MLETEKLDDEMADEVEEDEEKDVDEADGVGKLGLLAKMVCSILKMCEPLVASGSLIPSLLWSTSFGPLSRF